VDNGEVSRGGQTLSALALCFAAACYASHSPEVIGPVDSGVADTGTTVDSRVCPATPTLTPSSHDFVSCDPTAVTFTLTNGRESDTGTIGAAINGPDFEIVADTCSGVSLAPCDSCTVTVRYRPTTTGSHAGQLFLSASPGGSVTATLTGTCTM
jgi:hypothetical protein